MYLPPNPALDPQLRRVFQRTPKTNVFDECWLRRQLAQAGCPDPVRGLQWLLMAGLLTVRGVSPAGHWQLARATAPRPAGAPPSLYVPAAGYEPLASGGYYPALPPAVCRYLARQRFNCFADNESEEVTARCTLAQLATRLNQPPAEDYYLRQALDAAGSDAVHYQEYLPVVLLFCDAYSLHELTSPLKPQVLTLSFDRYTNVDVAHELLVQDLGLANYLLLVFPQPLARQLTAVVRQPQGFTTTAEALEALAAYCRQRFQARGCACRVEEHIKATRLGIGRPAWLHPSLLRAARATRLMNG